MLWSELEAVLVAVALGVLIGAERERSHRDVPTHFGGVRTFAILALLGALAQVVSTATVAIGLAAVAALIGVTAWQSIQTHHGSTTVFAGLATYLLGSLTDLHPQLAVALAVGLVVLLVSKEGIHRVLRERVTDLEVHDAVKLAVFAFVILPLLPDRDMGPYGVLNPSRIWLLVVSVTGIGWLGYLGVRLLGSRRGLLVTGAAGGFVSASSTTAAMGRIAKSEPERFRPALAGALMASVSTMVQLVLVVAIGSRPVAIRLLAPAVAVAVALLAEVFVLVREPKQLPEPEQPGEPHKSDATQSTLPAHDVEQEAGSAQSKRQPSAFGLAPALILAAVITLTLLISRWAADRLGQAGTVSISALAGLADGHAGALSAAAQAGRGEISTTVALWAAAASIGTNTMVKLVLAIASGGAKFGRMFATRILLAAVLAFVVLQLT